MTETTAAFKTELRLAKGDITKVSYVEAIVNAANKSLPGGGGKSKVAGFTLTRICALGIISEDSKQTVKEFWTVNRQ